MSFLKLKVKNPHVGRLKRTFCISPDILARARNANDDTDNVNSFLLGPILLPHETYNLCVVHHLPRSKGRRPMTLSAVQRALHLLCKIMNKYL